MTTLQKGVLWVTGCLILVFAMSIGLSWYTFEYLDSGTVLTMTLMLLPVLGAAAVVAVWSEAEAPAATKGMPPEESSKIPVESNEELVGSERR